MIKINANSKLFHFQRLMPVTLSPGRLRLAPGRPLAGPLPVNTSVSSTANAGRSPPPATNQHANPDERASRLLDGPKVGLVGHLQRRTRHVFLLAGGRMVTSTELVARCYPRTGGAGQSWRYARVRRAAERWATRVGRLEHQQGRPWLWAPKPELMELIRGGKSIPGASQLASPPADRTDKP